MKDFTLLHKGGMEVWINFNFVVRIDHHERGSHIDFTDVGLEEVVDETPSEILEILK